MMTDDEWNEKLQRAAEAYRNLIRALNDKYGKAMQEPDTERTVNVDRWHILYDDGEGWTRCCGMTGTRDDALQRCMEHHEAYSEHKSRFKVKKIQ